MTGKRGKPTHAEAIKKHVLTRAYERYGLQLDYADLDIIRDAILRGEYEIIPGWERRLRLIQNSPMAKDATLEMYVSVHGVQCKVAANPVSGVVRTFLPLTSTPEVNQQEYDNEQVRTGYQRFYDRWRTGMPNNSDYTK